MKTIIINPNDTLVVLEQQDATHGTRWTLAPYQIARARPDFEAALTGPQKTKCNAIAASNPKPPGTGTK